MHLQASWAALVLLLLLSGGVCSALILMHTEGRKKTKKTVADDDNAVESMTYRCQTQSTEPVVKDNLIKVRLFLFSVSIALFVMS